jgi:DNA-binding NtrC family response regulator
MSHVLIVDDDANTRDALAALAQTEGFTTAVAGSVAEARVQLVRQRPDVVLMDLRLPDGSGMDLFEDLEDRGAIETVLVTGHASVGSAAQALRMGASDYLAKPVDVQRLKAVLSRVPKSGEPRAEIPAEEIETPPLRVAATPAITVPLGTPLSVAARELILSTLEHCGGERKRTAEMLGICTKTLYNRLREYGVREERTHSTPRSSRAVQRV